MDTVFEQIAAGGKIVVGMLHAPPLPGSPGYGGDWPGVVSAVLADASALVEGGVHGLMLENFGDVPFFAGRVPSEVVACLTHLAGEVKRSVGDRVPLGINVLRNDGESALAVATACGADYIRVNVLSGAVVTDQGVIQGDAARLMRRRREMGAEHVAVLSDVRVKHAAPFGAGWRSLEEDVEEAVLRGGAAGVIVSGTGTGKATNLRELAEVRAVVDAFRSGATPRPSVWVGSGANAETASGLLEHADGLIVGTSVKEQGGLGRPVDRKRVREVVAAAGG